ncbi:MAG: C40 family peptidase [Candidatus Krumholzibacteriia bacterium]
MIRRLVIVLTVLLLAGCSPKRVLRQPEAWPPPERPVHAAPRQAPPTVPPRSQTAPPRDLTDPDGALEVGLEVAELALTQLGRPYRWGGHSPERGFDCSGLVHWCYGCLGIDLPRVVRDQRRAGQPVAAASLQPGDLLFFAIEGDRISHVGLYLGDGEFVHAPRAGRRVRRDSLDDPYWRERWSDSRRVAAE